MDMIPGVTPSDAGQKLDGRAVAGQNAGIMTLDGCVAGQM